MKYSKETDAMIKKVRKAIEMTAGGSVPQEYEPQLVLLADNFENYIMCRDAIKKEGISYSKFVNGLKKEKIELDRKILADLVVNDPKVFSKIASEVKQSATISLCSIFSLRKVLKN